MGTLANAQQMLLFPQNSAAVGPSNDSPVFGQLYKTLSHYNGQNAELILYVLRDNRT